MIIRNDKYETPETGKISVPNGRDMSAVLLELYEAKTRELATCTKDLYTALSANDLLRDKISRAREVLSTSEFVSKTEVLRALGFSPEQGAK